ncbi:hypothetical protein [Liquorilactobacillus capillatus]|uniref:Uncharacterized protein n=1 Tax=Liquorilactobacillus capillatus DSM 19910 TaxID=1423731 RepID=A0A0R1M4X9_9LACO|nr:hypothetical protein [Liquorilactobacillus capillatus]KRL03151.1 hypothetical protein FC81_GL000152 [Liquorilactobacillus capillatus DSM 19910]
MDIMKEYGLSLLKGLGSFVILVALANLVKSADWRLLLNYYLLSNYIMLYPFNQRSFKEKRIKDKELTESLSRTQRKKGMVSETGTIEEATPLSRVATTRINKNDPREALLRMGFSLMKYTFLIVCAPLIFMQAYLLGKSEI